MSPRKDPSKKIVCACLQVTEAEVLEAIRTGEIASIRDLTRLTLAGDGCTACHPLLKEYLERRGGCRAAARGGGDRLYLPSGEPICSDR